MLPFRVIYHDGYDLNLGDHVFPSEKYRLVKERLVGEGVVSPEDIVAPFLAEDDDLALVHDRRWIQRLRTGTLSYQEVSKLEIPYSRAMVRAFRLAVGGTILAGRLALRDGIGFNLSGGFHHAFRDHGEGFCAFNDVAVAIRRIQRAGRIERAMVVDCDVHHGNGTASLLPATARFSPCPSTSTTTTLWRSRPPTSILIWPTRQATKSTSNGFGPTTCPPSRPFGRASCSTLPARIPTTRTSWGGWPSPWVGCASGTGS